MTTPTSRPHGRAVDALRPVSIELDPLKFAEGSALIEMGDTRVLVAATVQSGAPSFLENSGKGWATAEYAMLPRATSTRSAREVTRGKPSGRSSEIQRLIGRSVRSVLDLTAMPDRTLILDCDVLQADGGTRTASITGAYVAAVLALGRQLMVGEIPRWPFREQLAAISVGIVDGTLLLDLEASEDQRADVDMNIVATGKGSLVEVQGTGEEATFTRQELDGLLDLAFAGVDRLCEAQNQALAEFQTELDTVLNKADRKAAKPKDEQELWGKP